MSSKTLSKTQIKNKIREYADEMNEIRERHKIAHDYMFEDVMDYDDRARLHVLSEKIHSLRVYGDEHAVFAKAGKKGGITRRIHALEKEIADLKEQKEKLED